MGEATYPMKPQQQKTFKIVGGCIYEDTNEIWLRHLSLSSDRGDKDGVYPRKKTTRSDEAVKKTFKDFYGTMALYDLTRQWILEDGPFVCDYKWLSENYNQDHADDWGNKTLRGNIRRV